MYDLFVISDLLAEIRDTGSTISKEQLLIEGAEEEGFKEVLKFIYDPYFTTGLGQKKLDRVNADHRGEYMSPEEMMDYLKVNTTGTDDDAAIANGFIASYDDDEEAEWLAQAIVTKTMQIGVSVTTLNRVFGSGFIPKVGIMRGTLCPETISGMYIATEKIDGNRRLLFNRESGPEIYTRSGKRDYGLIEIEEQMKHLPKDYVYDTECVATGYFADSIALRQASASILNSGGIRYGVKAQVFDMIPIDEYDKGRSNYHALGRKAILAVIFGDIEGLQKLADKASIVNVIEQRSHTMCDISVTSKLNNIEVLPILGVVDNKEEALELAKPIWDAGGEGIMLVDVSSAYEVSPNPRKTLLKIKLLKEFVCECTGIVEGTNKYEGMMGAITVNYKRGKETYNVKVGSGFTDYQRDLYWQNPELIVGKKIEIESFGESKNAQGEYSINCPIFKRVAGEVD